MPINVGVLSEMDTSMLYISMVPTFTRGMTLIYEVMMPFAVWNWPILLPSSEIPIWRAVAAEIVSMDAPVSITPWTSTLLIVTRVWKCPMESDDKVMLCAEPDAGAASFELVAPAGHSMS